MGSLPSRAFWNGRRVLVTGHTGFKGAWLTCYLHRLGATVMGVSLPGSVSDPALWDSITNPSLIDVREDVAEQRFLEHALEFEPQVVLHLAAQALVGESLRDPRATFRSNVMGTVHVMSLLDQLPSLDAAVIVTTDKVYDTAQSTPYKESDFLGGGSDPYSASKASTELVVRSWPRSHPVGTARAGNVIGGGDWAPLRLLPDIVRAWSNAEPVIIRRPGAVRPWQHVIEPLTGYLLYAEHLASGTVVPRALNFGPSAGQSATVASMVGQADDIWTSLTGRASSGYSVVEAPSFEETDNLTLDPACATRLLNWARVWDWQSAVRQSLAWHISHSQGQDARELIDADLAAYEALVNPR